MAEDKTRPSGANQYSVYAQRDTESTQVDWSNIAKSLTDDLQKVAAEREKKKAEIEQGTADALAKLSEIEDINDNTLTQVIIDGSDNSKQTLVQAADLLSRGLITLKDYKLIEQQQLNGYANINKYVKNYDKALEEGNKRMLEGIASDLEIAYNEGTFDAADLKNKRLISNPKTGQLSLVTMVQNDKGEFVLPDPTTNPEKYKSADYLAKRQQFRLDKTNYQDEAQKAVDGLGTFIDSTISEYNVFSGGAAITKIEDFRQAFEMTKPTNEDGTLMTYDQFINDQINALVGAKGDKTSLGAAQVLSQLGYRAVESEAQAKENGYTKYYLYKSSNGKPVPQLTDEQLTVARDAAGRAFEAAITRKITKQQPLSGQQPTSATLGKSETDKRKMEYISDVNQVLTGDETQRKQKLGAMIDAENARRASAGRPQIDEVIITDDSIQILLENGETVAPYQRTVTDAEGNVKKTSVVQDLSFLYTYLVPTAMAETGEFAVSQSEIENLIASQNIPIGTEVLPSSYRRTIQFDPLTTTTKVQLDETTAVDAKSFFSTGLAEEKLGTVIGTKFGGGAKSDPDPQIQMVLDVFLSKFTRPEASKAQELAGITNIRTKSVGSPNPTITLEYDINGETKSIPVGSYKSGSQTSTMGDGMIRAMNKLNNEAQRMNKERVMGSPKTTDVPPLSPKVQELVNNNGTFPDLNTWTKNIDDDFKKQYSNKELQDIYKLQKEAFGPKK
jgi:hypothetical protein